MTQSGSRYLRHTLIDWFSQDEVARAKVAVIGAGAVGNEVLKCLALLGAGQIDIYDFDRIEVHNLTRSVLFRETDIGKNKAACAAERLRDLDPNIEVRAFPGDFWRTLDLAAFGDYSAVICCVDNFEARIRLNLLCKLWGVNLINTGIDSRYAVVDTFPFARERDASCYECTLPASVYQRMSQRYSCGGLKKAAFIEKRIPTTVITASLAGSLAASQALRLGAPAHMGSRRVFADSIAGTSSASGLPARADCPVCARFKGPVQISRARAAFTAELVSVTRSNAPETAEMTLPEPVIVSYHCKSCGQGEGQDKPLLWRAADHDAGLANCKSCAGEGAVDIQIRDKLPLAMLTEAGRLPVPFVMTASDWGTHIFLLERES